MSAANGTMKRGSFSLDELRPAEPIDPAEAIRRNLATVLLEQIKEEDVEAIGKNLVKRAREGNEKSVKLLFELLSRKTSSSPQPSQRAEREPVVIRETEKVVVESLGKRQLQRLIVAVVHNNGSLSVGAIANLCEIPVDQVPSLVDSPWFRSTPQGIILTPEGRQAV